MGDPSGEQPKKAEICLKGDTLILRNCANMTISISDEYSIDLRGCTGVSISRAEGGSRTFNVNRNPSDIPAYSLLPVLSGVPRSNPNCPNTNDNIYELHENYAALLLPVDSTTASTLRLRCHSDDSVICPRCGLSYRAFD